MGVSWWSRGLRSRPWTTTSPVWAQLGASVAYYSLRSLLISCHLYFQLTNFKKISRFDKLADFPIYIVSQHIMSYFPTLILQVKILNSSTSALGICFHRKWLPHHLLPSVFLVKPWLEMCNAAASRWCIWKAVFANHLQVCMKMRWMHGGLLREQMWCLFSDCFLIVAAVL